METCTHRARRAVLAVLVLVLAVAAAAPAAHAAPPSGPSAVVTMGDSYISGEAGRWQGNSVDPGGSRDGTDRACVFTLGVCTSYDKSKVYVDGTDANGCHRSDVSELLTAKLPVARRFNIACSGAVTKNIFRASQGGVAQDGEAPQADQLLPIARANRIRLIEVSIGGNDLGFASIVAACFEGYLAKTGPCEPKQQPILAAKLPMAIAAVKKAVTEIRATMTNAGYRDSDYRLVLQTYPSVIPRASEARYAEVGAERATFGCPFYDQDLTWGRDMASKEIGAAVKAAASASPGVELLDLGDAFQGRELCSKTTTEVTPLNPPSPTSSEWGRILSGSTIQQGDLQEAFHPNAYGQRAFAACLTQLYAQTAPGDFNCTNTPGQGPDAMVLARTATFPVAHKPARRRAAHRRTRPRRRATPHRRRAHRHVRRAAVRPRFTG